MGDSTSIEWTDATWNPVRGCSRVSKGCEHCYAETVAGRFSGPGQPYEGLVRLRASGKHGRAQWNGTVRMVPEHLADPLRWTKPRRVFVNSMSDLFHEALAFEDIAAIFGVMAGAPHHSFQVLTKRPERAREFFAWLDERGNDPVRECSDAMEARRVQWTWPELWPDWPLPNVWIGTSVEDQATADERIPHLLACPAAVRFVSYEPALGPLDLRRFMWPVHARWTGPHPSADAARAAGETVTMHRQALVHADRVFIDWVIVGGESGPGARPFDLAWARSVVTQCREAGVPAFFKQAGAQPVDAPRDAGGFVVTQPGGDPWPSRPVRLRHRKGADLSELPAELRVREFPSPKDTTR